jgi:hypothetical protein
MLRAMRFRWICLCAIATAAGCFGNTCNNPPGPPPPDVCDTPSTDGVTKVSVGAFPLDADDTQPVVPLVDGDMPRFATGGQGLTMLPLRLRLDGPSPPACVAQATRVIGPMGMELAHSMNPLETYAQPDGSRTTKAEYLVIGGPQPSVDVQVVVGTLTTQVHLGEPWPDMGAPDDTAAPPPDDAAAPPPDLAAGVDEASDLAGACSPDGSPADCLSLPER